MGMICSAVLLAAVAAAPAVVAQSTAKQDRQISVREDGRRDIGASFDVGLFPAQFEHRMLRQKVGEAVGARLVSRQKPLAFNLDIPFV